MYGNAVLSPQTSRLLEQIIDGAVLVHNSVEAHNCEQLKRWLKCHGLPKKRKKAQLIESGLLPVDIQRSLSPDAVQGKTATEKGTDFSPAKIETGWDRVKRIFLTDDFGALSLELQTIIQASCMSTFVGALYGGIMNSRTAYLDFMRRNQATIFRDHIDAKRQLHDAVTTSFAKGAFRWGWRLCVFTTSFVGISTIIGSYRGKSGITEYVAAGAASGFLYKFKHGPRAWVVGTGLGAVLGLMAGSMTLGILRLSGISLEEARYWQHHWYDQRSLAFKKSVEKYMEGENPILTLHDKQIGESGKDLMNLDDVNKSVTNNASTVK